MPGAAFTCPCRGPCPRCGYVNDEPEHEHPLDGLAGCARCPLWHTEWWAHAGPHMDGRHPSSPAEAAEWAAYDDQFLPR